ncbi:hypothetical protein [Caudoviricetes sp.]|nr:hypothetical protein [Caudoviricetes sp.]UOF81126.1 hypothetical protein [Caudoviricetes sp.]UOF82238.1 hypothetical protein [Caudoviricetes sp.]UOF82471.1 hypothetical protein [Caudoviricetes sp.]UOF82625.1 hypothetical protein [Caudoviricetes sp.]
MKDLTPLHVYSTVGGQNSEGHILAGNNCWCIPNIKFEGEVQIIIHNALRDMAVGETIQRLINGDSQRRSEKE